MTLPGMRERTARIGSAGKTLSLTGWKVGYISAGPVLLETIAKAHQFLTFTTPPNLQAAVAYGLGKDDGFFTGLSIEPGGQARSPGRGPQTRGFEVLETQGTYFMTADFRPLGFNGPDDEFCQFITKEAGVAAVPVSAFCEEPRSPISPGSASVSGRAARRSLGPARPIFRTGATLDAVWAYR